MHHSLDTTLLLLSLLPTALSFGNSNKAPSKNAILLSKVETLTLHSGRETSSRRVSPIPQLRCTGPSRKICSLYEVDVMRCTNQGSEYDEEDIQWTCSASLPPEFKLGSTDVICEGYKNSDDPWVLKGSCGVEYRLLLTDAGEQRFGRIEPESSFSSGLSPIFVIAAVFLAFILITRCLGSNNDARGRGGNYPGGGGWGGGGGGGGGPFDPPPPYDSRPSWGSSFNSRRGYSGGSGFWPGALGGAAAGYGLASMNRSSGSRSSNRDPWEGGSGSSGSRSSTGFGSTRRR